MAEYERRKGEFQKRRDYLVPALNDLGLTVPVIPDGAFYAWADCSAFSPRWGAGSWEFAFEVLRQTQVAITPGRDFGPHLAQQFVRLSFANSMTQLEEAVARLARMLSQPR